MNSADEEGNTVLLLQLNGTYLPMFQPVALATIPEDGQSIWLKRRKTIMEFSNDIETSEVKFHQVETRELLPFSKACFVPATETYQDYCFLVHNSL